jgi:hypothetical protein
VARPLRGHVRLRRCVRHECSRLTAADTQAGTVVDDPTSNFNTANPTGNQGIKIHDVTVAAGSTYARFSLFDDFTDGADDLDLYVYRVGAGGALTLAGSSGSGTSAEEVNLSGALLRARTRCSCTAGDRWSGRQLHAFLVGARSGPAGNLTRDAVHDGGDGWRDGHGSARLDGLDTAKKYLGAVDYSGSIGMPTTIVRIG